MRNSGKGPSYRRYRLSVLMIGTAASALGCDSGVSEPDDALAGRFSAWSPAVRVESLPGTHSEFNTSSLDGCPLRSRDGKKFFMASDRPGGLGGIDIWVSTRASENDPWGAPANLGAPINSSADDFCPTIDRDGIRFFFVSARAAWSGGPGCGGADIYVTRFRGDGSAEDPQNLGCESNGGPNSAASEASPSPLPSEGNSGEVLYFSSARAGGFAPTEAAGAIVGDQDVYVSRFVGGKYGRGELATGVNSAADDAQPNVRRDGLEIFFFSTRPGGLGAADIYSATRARTADSWSVPGNAGGNVNTAASETRPSVSWDGTSLVFGSTRPGGEGSTDIYIATRVPVAGGSN
ncbi:MAG TPA: hypothetical protein VNJ04_04865 [Gemmatimonadaceae bacterium]|nr:hypothetical protein [Gemmatimonadaceae bacterium]